MKCGAVQGIGGLHSTAHRKQEVLKLNSEAGYFVVVDLEGTRIRIGLANFLGDIRYRWEEDLWPRAVLEVDDIVAGIQVVLRSLDEAERSSVLAVGVSYTGMMDESGAVTAVNLGWKDFPLSERLRERVDLPIFYDNDGFCKVLAERWLGVAENSNNCIYVMAGVGIGIGCYVNGHLLTGEQRLAGEFGHLTIDPNAPDRCNCGKTGCLEAIVSSPNIVRQYLAKSGRSGERLEAHPVTEVFARARGGDPAAGEVLDRVGHYLGLGLSHVVNILNPAVIVLGGDLIAAQDLLIPAIQRELHRHCPPRMIAGLELKASTLGHDSGLRGAASLAFNHAVQDERLLKKITSPLLLRARRDAQKFEMAAAGAGRPRRGRSSLL
jgi:glucokinase